MPIPRLSKTRKLWLNGGTIVVSLPMEICEGWGWAPGDDISVSVNNDGKQLILEKGNAAATGEGRAA